MPGLDVCVTRPTAVFTADRLLAAMQKELPAAHIELLDFSRQPAPEGELAFPAAGLRQAATGGYWSGYVTYGGRHHFTLWARVRVRMAATRVIAVQDIKPGAALEAALFRVETREEIPATGFAGAVEEVAGMTSRRANRRGNGVTDGVAGGGESGDARGDRGSAGRPWRSTSEAGRHRGGLGSSGRDHPDSEPRIQTTFYGKGRRQRQGCRDEGKFMKFLVSVLLIGSLTLAAKKKAAPPPQSPLDHFVTDARARSAAAPVATPGGIWAPGIPPGGRGARPQSQPDR